MSILGRNVVISKTTGQSAPFVIAGLKTKTWTINGTPVDVTSDDSTGWRELMDDAGLLSMDLSGEGFLEDDEMIAEIISGTIAATYTVSIDGIGDFTGKFALVSVASSAETSTAATQTISLQSAGVITYTPET